MIRMFFSLAVLGVLVVGIAGPASAAPVEARDILPPGENWPAVASAELMAPQPHNALLEVDIAVEALDETSASTYEYRWNGATQGTPFALDTSGPVVSYETVVPATSFELEVRVIDVNHRASDWYFVWTGLTPDVPNVIVAGDSIASGYTRDWFTGPASCTDGGTSYGSVLAADIAADLPAQWAPRYSNIAWAGAGVGHMVDGGSDSCGSNHRSQVAQITELASDDTWNVVAITAGINSTNWTDVVVDLTRDATFSLTSSGDKSVCGSALRNNWNIESRRSFVTDATESVSAAITNATNAKVLWTGYYDITDTEFAPLWRPITGACSGEMATALESLHTAIRSGLAERVAWVDIDRGISTQKWAGWPHPDNAGQATIGHALAEALDS